MAVSGRLALSGLIVRVRAGTPHDQRTAYGLGVRPRALVVTAGVAAAASAAVVLLVPWIHVSYRSTPTHIALETAEGMAGLVVVVLVFGRFLQRGLTRDLFVSFGLGMLMSANLLLAVVPTAISGDRETAVGTWGPAAARLIGALALMIGALFEGGHLELARRRRAGVAALVSVTVLVGALAVSISLLDDRLPPAVQVTAGSHLGPVLEPHRIIYALQLIAATLFALAAFGFLRRAERDGDELFGWFAAGAIVSVVARASYLLVPSLYTDYVHIGDFLRLAAYGFYLTGGIREIARYWRSLAGVAVADDRRRMARDLHDGLAHELAFIARQARVLAADPQHAEQLQPMIAAADRALDESRAAIHALTMEEVEPLDLVLADAAGEVAGRLGLTVDLHLDRDVTVELPVQEALARVVREAVGNAARHGRVSTIQVTMTSGPPLRVVVEDDGTGFEPGATPRPGAHGLVSMRERVKAAGGTLVIRSSPGSGTTVEVTLP